MLTSVLQAIAAGELTAVQISVLFCNRETGEADGSDNFIAFAKQNKIQVMTLSSAKFKQQNPGLTPEQRRQDYDRAVLKKLADCQLDLVVMAGYMLIAPLICAKYRTINIHPALPNGPKGIWRNVIKELIQDRSGQSGVTVHYATNDVDRGEPVLVKKYPIPAATYNTDQETAFQTIRALQLKHEKTILVDALNKLTSN